MEVKKKVSFKELFGWCMFDFANSSYTTVIISVIYCDVFTRFIVPAGSNPTNPNQEGNFLWGIALFISYMIVVFTGPIVGAITDFSANKKRYLLVTYLGCIISTAMLYFVAEPNGVYISVAFVLIILSNLFFASGENIASSFLPSLGPKEELGKISGYAWGIGYFGGVLSVLLVDAVAGKTIAENFNGLRLVGPATAFFFLIAGIPTFAFLKEYGSILPKPKDKTYLQLGFETVFNTLKDIRKFRDMQIYLISLFFAMAGIGVVISFAFIYGNQEIKIEDSHRTAMFLLIQVSAALGAVAFGFLQDRFGAKKTFSVTLIIWVIGLVCINQVVNIQAFLASIGITITVQWLFVIITSLTGMGLGATQSSSRAIVGMFSPEIKTGEFFGLWGLSGKLATAIGIFMISWLQTIFSLRNSFLAVAAFFILAFIANQFVDEKRGIETAKNYKE